MRIFTDNDVLVMQNTVTAIDGLILEGPVGEQNGAAIGNWFKHNPQIAVTTDSVRQVVEQLRQSLQWKTTLQLEADRVASTMTEVQVTAVCQFIKSRGLLDDADNLLTNFVVIGAMAQAKNYGFDFPSLDKLLTGYLTNSVNGSRLRWKPRLQDSEKEAAQRRSEQATPTRTKNKSELLDDSKPRLSPQMEHHKWMLHNSTEPIAPKPKDDTDDWKQLAEDVLQNTRSNVVRDKARKIMFANNGVPDWKAIYHARRRLIEQSGVR